MPCNSECGDFLHPEIPLFYQGVCRNPRRPITVAVKEERGSKGVAGTRSFGRLNPCKWGGKHDWLRHKTVGVLLSTQWHAKKCETWIFESVHHLWFGSSQRPRRGRIPWVGFRGVIWGVALRYIIFVGLERVFVWDMSPGARL